MAVFDENFFAVQPPPVSKSAPEPSPFGGQFAWSAGFGSENSSGSGAPAETFATSEWPPVDFGNWPATSSANHGIGSAARLSIDIMDPAPPTKSCVGIGPCATQVAPAGIVPTTAVAPPLEPASPPKPLSPAQSSINVTDNLFALLGEDAGAERSPAPTMEERAVVSTVADSNHIGGFASGNSSSTPARQWDSSLAEGQQPQLDVINAEAPMPAGAQVSAPINASHVGVDLFDPFAPVPVSPPNATSPSSAPRTEAERSWVADFDPFSR